MGNQNAAIQLLHDAIVSRWFQHNLLALDAIMLKFVELCVDLRKGRLAKDGLHQYRNLSQSINMAGLEKVMVHFLDVAEAKLEAAYKVATDASSVDTMGDLDQASEETFNLIWSSTTEEVDRSGRALATPWLRFVWEVYRTILEICRHNSRLEEIYRVVVERAFVFCRQYGRKAEFRRLCEILRHHLGIIIKFPGQANGVQLQNPDSQSLQLELRFKQLDVATEMELWHEAFRSIEDIHGLFLFARKSVLPSLVITYYSRLCRIFQMGNKFLYLAATICKLFAISKAHEQQYDRSHADATLAVLALIATPIMKELDATNTMSEEEQDTKNSRLSMFLGLQKTPTRRSIIKELHSRGILEQASEAAHSLFVLMQNSNDNSTIADQRENIERSLVELESCSADYSRFVTPVYRNYVAQVLEQLSKTEKFVSFESIYRLISMPSVNATKAFNLEGFIIEGCRVNDFYIRIDHIRKGIIFTKPCFAAAPSLEINDPSKSKLVQLFSLLYSLGVLPQKQKVNIDVAETLAALEMEHQQNLLRRSKIDKRKEQIEARQQMKEREEQRERAHRLQVEREAEAARQAEESIRREKTRLEQEKEAIRKEQAAKREEEERKRKEAMARRANLEKVIAAVKRLDHLERAFRQEEVSLLKEDYERQKKADRAAYEERVALIISKAKTQHEADLLLKKRLASMTADYSLYNERLTQRRMAALAKKEQQVLDQLEKAKNEYRERILTKAKARTEREKAEEELYKQKEESEHAASLTYAPMRRGPEVSAEHKQSYIPPSKRQQQAQSQASRTSAFGSRSTSGSGIDASGPAVEGSWRRQ